ncbi:hypothetical protein BASA60_004554 [Batrachochytrium salamandrivorans]|nr:hypothetical protein BASA60_004554 [Batrachochytrium salamandrivorans]
MGIIKLDSFDPEDVETKIPAVEKAVMIVRSLLANELKDTKSVMYELRGNSGGDADFASSMIQLFKPDFHPFGGRYLMNQITFNLVVNGKDPDVDPYARAWQETEPGSRFTDVFFLNSVESVNTLGQAYVRPMGVLNDARCYSSCEVFSGSIQGHGVGTIFGEDKQTGGGGATVVELDPFLIRASPSDFQKFPFSQQLTSGSKTYTNALTVGVTKTTRTGLYNGQDIEDVGIRQILFSSPSGLICSPAPLPTPSMTVSPKALLVLVERTVRADGKTVIAKQRRSRATTKQKFSLPVSTVGSALGNSHITIVGKTAGKQVLKTNRNVRIIPDDDKYMKISTLAMSILPIEAFFTAPVGTKINIGLDVALDTDPGFDFLYLSVKSSGGVEDFLTRSKSLDGTKTFNGISGRNMLFEGNIFPSLQMVMGKAYYGLELVGGNKSHLAPLQTTINKGIRLFTGARLSTAIGPLLVETGIGSLLTRSLVSRVRLLERSVTKKTPINAICSGTDNDVFTLNVQGQLVRSQRWFWSRRTKQLYRNRYWLTPQVRPKTVKQRHSFALMETLRTCGDSASLQKYVTRQFLDTSGFFKDPSFDQSRAHGTRYLMLARMDALWTARKAIQIGILVDTHPFSVDHCILCDQQLLSTSIAHLVVECEQVLAIAFSLD